MARIPRMIITGEPTVYYIISRTALDGLVLGDVEKDYQAGAHQALELYLLCRGPGILHHGEPFSSVGSYAHEGRIQ